MPDPFPGIKQLLQRYRRAGGIICVSSMSAHDTILRDYRTLFGLEPDALFGWDIPEEYRKPHPYALVEVQKRYGLKPEEILVVDDMKFAVPMARSVGCPIAFAGWGRQQFPDIYREMENLCDHTFSTVTALEEFLFEV
jgi:phosphoglycolate phosphatase/pyrophosphatase PpaX